MSRESYERCMEWTRHHMGVDRVRFLVKFLTIFTAVCYAAIILRLFVLRDAQIRQVVFLPAAGFFMVTLLRKGIGARRPYEVYGFTPLLDKDSKKNSFPSRHVFSNTIIAVVVLKVWMPLGILLLAGSVCLAVLRVITGVHFPRDVIAGGVFAVVLGVMGSLY